MKKDKISRFFGNMGFMFRRSWELSGSIYFVTALQYIIGTVRPFVMLLIPKYILDELAGQRRPDITIKYIALYAAVIIIFNVLSIILNRYAGLKSSRVLAQHGDARSEDMALYKLRKSRERSGKRARRAFGRAARPVGIYRRNGARLYFKRRTARGVYLYNRVAASAHYPDNSGGDRSERTDRGAAQ